MNLGLHHFKYTYDLQKEERSIVQNPGLRKLLGKSVYAIGVIGVAFTIPQIMKIWIDHNADGVSLLTWLGFTGSSAFWLFYGIVHKDNVIISSSAGGVIADLLVILGVIVIGPH